MRKIFFGLILLLTACSPAPHKESAWESQNGKLKLLSTTSMINDLVKEVAGDLADCEVLIRGELDPHTYELVKGDEEKFVQADLVFYNGLGLEHGYNLRRTLQNHPRSFALGDLVREKDPERILSFEGSLDPHIWMDIELFSTLISPIVEALCSKDPSHADLFKERGLALKEALLKEDQSAFDELQKIPQERRYLVSSHNAFSYFVKRYLSAPQEVEWKRRLASPEGIAPDSEIGAFDLQEVIDFVKEHRIATLFIESNVNTDPLKKIVQVCQKQGMDVTLMHTPLLSDSMGDKGSYLEMMRHNIETIAHAL